MQETAQQYTQRILGYLEGKPPLEILTATAGQIAQLIEGLAIRKLVVCPGPNQWSVAEVLAHLADTELVYGFRIRLILEASGTPIQGIDQDAWARFSDYARHDPALSLEAFRVTRERLVRLLQSLPRESWDCYGMHSERGKETLLRVAEMLAGHDIAHVKQISANLSKT